MLTSIHKGKFAIGKDQKGNFSCQNSKGQRIFIPKEMMNALGWKADKDVVFPFYAIVNEETIGTRDEDGNLTTNTVQRLTATQIAKDSDEIMEIDLEDTMLAIKRAEKIEDKIKGAGLSETTSTAILAQSKFF